MRLPALLRDLRFAGGVAAGRPFQALVQVTNRCNMKCSFCGFWPNGAPPRQELTVAEYVRVADELAALGTCLVSIEGGEPFIRPDLLQIVGAFGRRHLPLVYTNGWFMDRARARGLFAAGAAHVGVSIDFPEAARHDAKRGLRGTFERAVAALELLRDEAPDPLRVHVMTVLLRENQDDLPALLALSRRLGVGHCVTLLSLRGFRRDQGPADDLPDAAHLRALPSLWEEHGHLRVFRGYLEGMAPFASGGPLPRCRAGVQSFNLDHLGNVSPCIEKIDRTVGNVRTAPLAELLGRLRARDEGAGCQDCWTLCRGVGQALGERGSLAGWRDLAGRMRSR